MSAIKNKITLMVSLTCILSAQSLLGQTIPITPLPNTNLKDLKVLLMDDLSSGDHQTSAGVAGGYWDEFSKQYGFRLTKSTSASDINTNNLKNFTLIVVNYTNRINEYLNPDQQNAFKAFVDGGGHVIGYHTAAMPRAGDWDWYRENVIIGSYNPNYHGLRSGKMVRTKDQAVLDLPNSKNLLSGVPEVFTATDEWYAFNQGPNFGEAKVLYYIDEASMGTHTHSNLDATQMALPVEKRHPILWYREHPTSKSRVFYTGIIHNPTGARSDFFKLIILRAAEFASGYKAPNPIINAKMLKAFPERLSVTASPDLLRITVEDAGNFQVTLHEVNGAPVLRKPLLNTSLSIERSDLSPGNYLLRISSEGKTIATRMVSWL